MATPVVMEALSPTMEEGRLVEWKKREGDAVAAGDVLAEVETDKAVMELVARAPGTLLKQTVAAGATVPVSAVVAWIGTPGEALPGDGKTTGGAESPKPEPKRVAAAVPAPPAAAAATPAVDAATTTAHLATLPRARVKASPLARRIAAERGVDLRAVSGSGPEGRVVKRDLEGAATAASASPRPTALPSYADVPLTQIRKTIAKRLAQSIGPIPTFYLTTEIDMERAADLREQITAVRGEEAKVSFNDLIVRAVALALVKHPGCNAWWQEDSIRYWNEVHVGVAVAVKDGLITPVIRNADRKSLAQIGTESKALAARARDRRLKPEEYTGATFSVSNLGMYDIEHFTAVINPPEGGILAVGTIARVPAVIGDQVVPRRRMRVTMSCDHRVIDGATGAEFLKTLKLMLENPVVLAS
jgi:pyruvate dehydrogenase E2 component (dihydrolipoamide acetyltransferase)